MICYSHAHSCSEAGNEIWCQSPSLIDFDMRRLVDTDDYIQWEVYVYNTGPPKYSPQISSPALPRQNRDHNIKVFNLMDQNIYANVKVYKLGWFEDHDPSACVGGRS